MPTCDQPFGWKSRHQPLGLIFPSTALQAFGG
jgi:hypothetical protein